MSRDNGKKYPRTIESKNSYLRIRAPEHLDVALEGLIRKVLKEQPKMDDIYAFAADYFDMLLKIREKAGIRKLSVQDICPQHNEEDANDMIKLASTFTKCKRESKPMAKGYRAISLKHIDRREEKKGMKAIEKDVKKEERFNIALPIVNEHPELEDVKPVESSTKNEKTDPETEESNLDLIDRPKAQDTSEKIIEAREVIFEEDDGMAMETDTETVGGINKIETLENETQSLEERENETFKESGNSVGEIMNEINSDTNDVVVVDATPIVEEPIEESESTKPNVENEVIIEEVTDDKKKEHEMKENAENSDTTQTETKTEKVEEIQERVSKVESTVKQVEGAEPKVEGDNGISGTNTLDETLTEETQDSEVNNAIEDGTESSLRVEERQEEKSSIEIAEERQVGEKLNHENNEEIREEKPSSETIDKVAEEEKPSDEILVEEAQEGKPKDETSSEDQQEVNAGNQVVVDNAQEELKDEIVSEDAEEGKTNDSSVVEEELQGKLSVETGSGDLQEKESNVETESIETLQEKPTENIEAEEKSERSKELEVDMAEGAEPKEGTTEESEMKAEAENVSEDPPVTDVNKEDTVEEKNDAAEIMENSKGEEGVAVEARSIDAAEAQEAKLLGGGGSENEKSETEKFIGLEKQPEDIQNLSDAPTEEKPTVDTDTDDVDNVTHESTVVQQDAKEGQHEENITEPVNEENSSGHTQEFNSAAKGAAVIASGIGAAAILDQVKKELTTEKEITKEEKTEKDEVEASAEDDLIRPEPEEELTLAEEVEKFLDRERQLSSYDKETEELVGETSQEDKSPEALDTEVISKNVPGSLARMTLPESEVKDGEIPESKEQLGPSDVEAEDDDQEKDGSTTSDEIEFEVSPLKNTGVLVDSETSALESGSHGENSAVDIPGDEESDTKKKDTEDEKTDELESRLVVEVEKSESIDQTKDSVEDVATEQTMVFLEVPEPVMEEYPKRKMAPQKYQSAPEGNMEQSGNAEEEIAMIDCANVGNEIIQTGEIQKVELIEGEEDILQVHLTTTIETAQDNCDSLHVQMTSKVEPTFEISVETRMESPVLDEKMRLIRAAVVIQNGFRRFRKRKVTGESLDNSTDELDTTMSESKLDLSLQTIVQDASSRESGSSFSSSATKISKGRNLSRSATRTLLETHSLDQPRKITPLKTRSLSSVRYGVADFEVWNQLVRELEQAATKIQSKYRGYKTRKKLQRENAIQSTRTTSEESSIANDSSEVIHRHTGEFHDSIVLPLLPR